MACFTVFRGLIYFEPTYRAYLRQVFEECLKDSISYIEIRLVFWFEYVLHIRSRASLPAIPL